MKQSKATKMKAQHLVLPLITVLLFTCLILGVAHGYDITVTKPGYYKQRVVGTEVPEIGGEYNIEIPGKSTIFELTTRHVSGDDPALTIQAYLKNSPNVTFSAITDDNIYQSSNLALYRWVMETSTTDPIIINIQTNEIRVPFSFGYVEIADTYNATTSQKVLEKAQFFLAAITYPFFALIVLLLIIATVVVYFVFEHKKDNDTLTHEIPRKRYKALLILVFGIVLILISIGFVIVVPFFTQRDTQDYCCTYIKRIKNYDGAVNQYLPEQSYWNNCARVGFDSSKEKSFVKSCFGQETFAIKYKANIWWWLLIVGTIPGIVLYCVGHALSSIALFKLIRLSKRQEKSKGVTKFKIGLSD
jgi:heme/copper-type cytochrome/quinol oxidase subunit 2